MIISIESDYLIYLMKQTSYSIQTVAKGEQSLPIFESKANFSYRISGIQVRPS